MKGLVDVLVGAPSPEVPRVVALPSLLGVDRSPVFASRGGGGSSATLSALQVRLARHKDDGHCDLLSVTGQGRHGSVCMDNVI